MKKLNLHVAIVCMLAMAVIGVSLVAYAGPCYTQTSTVPASQKGCQETFISRLGQACPSKQYVNPDGVVPSGCSDNIHENSFGAGTSGNEPSGRMSQGFVTRSCYSYETCTLKGPYFDGLPLADGMYYLCASNGRTPTSATASSFEPTGADCPNE